MEKLQIGKQIGKFLDMPKRPQAPKPIFLGQETEKYENKIIFSKIRKYLKFAHGMSVHNGSYAFPNELVRFRI